MSSADTSTDTELLRLVDTFSRVCQHIGAMFQEKGVPLPELKEGDRDLSIAAARSSLLEYIERLREESERLKAIHELVADDILFCSREGGFFTTDDDKSALTYSVFCSDTFHMACADAEKITPDEAITLHAIMRDRPTGISQGNIATAWVAWKRGLTRADIVYREAMPPEEAFQYFESRISSGTSDEPTIAKKPDLD